MKRIKEQERSKTGTISVLYVSCMLHYTVSRYYGLVLEKLGLEARIRVDAFPLRVGIFNELQSEGLGRERLEYSLKNRLRGFKGE